MIKYVSHGTNRSTPYCPNYPPRCHSFTSVCSNQRITHDQLQVLVAAIVPTRLGPEPGQSDLILHRDTACIVSSEVTLYATSYHSVPLRLRGAGGFPGLLPFQPRVRGAAVQLGAKCFSVAVLSITRLG